MYSSEISFDDYLLWNLVVKIKVSKCHIMKVGKIHEVVGKERDGTIFQCTKRPRAVCAPLP